MKSVGIDIYKRNSYLPVMDEEETCSNKQNRKSREVFSKFLADLASPCQIAMESTYIGQWSYDFLEELEQVESISIAHSLKTKAIPSVRIKNDKANRETLAHLLRPP